MKRERHTIQRIRLFRRSGGRTQVEIEDDMGVIVRYITNIEAPNGWHGEYSPQYVGEATALPDPLEEWVEKVNAEKT